MHDFLFSSLFFSCLPHTRQGAVHINCSRTVYQKQIKEIDLEGGGTSILLIVLHIELAKIGLYVHSPLYRCRCESLDMAIDFDIGIVRN